MMLIFKTVKDRNIITGFSDDTEENLKQLLFNQGYFVFLIREPNEQELEFIKNFNNNIQENDTDT